jgi:hypothetical protein
MAYAKTSLRAEKRALREKMRAMGLGYPEITAELARRYRFRPRAAWREAYGCGSPPFPSAWAVSARNSPDRKGSAQASELDEQVEEFGRDTIVAVLSALPG